MGVKITGLTEHIEELDDAADNAEDLTAFTKKAVVVITTNFWPKRWRRQRDPDGIPWAAWSQDYAASLTRRGKGGNRILRDRGDLLGSVATSRVTNGTKTSIIIGTNHPSAATHQFGRPQVNIPQREFLGFSVSDLNFLDNALADFILQGETP